MPTYDYECKKCGLRFEKVQPITAPLLEKCLECGGELRRLIGAGAAVIFKGSGFYATDYRKSEYKEQMKKEEGKKPVSHVPEQKKPEAG